MGHAQGGSQGRPADVAGLSAVVRAATRRVVGCVDPNLRGLVFDAPHPGPLLSRRVRQQVRDLVESMVSVAFTEGAHVVRRVGVRRREGLPGKVSWVVFLELEPVDGGSPGTGVSWASGRWETAETAVNSMGGRLTVEAEGPGLRTVVAWATLPGDFHIDTQVEPDAEAFAGLWVLVVDDNRVNQAVLEGLLRRWGCRVCTADDGLQAVHLLQRQSFDMVLMDLQMPIMDGYAATRWIRSQPGSIGRLPVVAVSANCAPEDRQRSATAGVDGHLGKPVHGWRLEAMLRTVLRARRPSPGRSGVALR